MSLQRKRSTVAAAALCAVWMTAGTALAAGPLSAKVGIAANLRALMEAKKPVTVVLKGGAKSYTAHIADVGEDCVVLTELSGKEFFDAVVEIDEIAAIEVRARDK